MINLSPEVRMVRPIAAGNQNWMTQVLGESPGYFDIRQWTIAEGGSFTEQDVRGANKVAVIGTNHRRPALRRRPGTGPDSSHPERALHYRGNSDPQGPVGAGPGPGRPGHHPLHQRDETGPARDDVARDPGAGRQRRDCSARCNSRSPNCSGNATVSGRGGTTISRCAPSRK